MTDNPFKEMCEEVYDYLLENGPVYHGVIQEDLGMSEREIGHALMYLYDSDKADWPSPAKWVAIPEKEEMIEMETGTIQVAYK